MLYLMETYDNNYGGAGFPYEEDELAAALAPDNESDTHSDPHCMPYAD